MKTVLLTLVVAVVAAAGTSLVLVDVGDDTERNAEIAELTRLVDELRRSNESLTRSVDDLRAAAALPRPSAGASFSQEMIDDAVARALEDHVPPATSGKPDSALAAAEEKAAEEARREIDEYLAKLGDESISWEDRELLWQELRDKGLMDEVIEHFEALVEADPHDPDLRVALGEAYLQKIPEVGSGPMAGYWATKADDEFDSALDMDDHNWPARFSKAVSLSFWPPVLGKQGEAISHFETLIAQQEASGMSEPGYAESYLFLGNMYSQMGQPEKALSVWQQGLAFFPDHSDLLAQVEYAQ